MQCIQTLSQFSIIVSCGQIYFTSSTYRNIFVKGDEEYKTITDGWDLTKFLLLVIIVEHVLIVLKILIE